jgi:predicted molibdopterin-dependent oxidoreductase YjgC
MRLEKRPGYWVASVMRPTGSACFGRGETMWQTSGERLNSPLVRENGKHRPATWEEALDRVAKGLRSEVAQHGPLTFGMFSCSKTTNELNYTAQKFVRSVIGCNNIDSCNRT